MVFKIFKQGAAPEEATRFTFYETIGKLFPIVTDYKSLVFQPEVTFYLRVVVPVHCRTRTYATGNNYIPVLPNFFIGSR